MDKFFYIEFYAYHNLQIWAKLVGLRSLHDAVLDPVAVLPGTGMLFQNNYWTDGQHKVPGIKCSHTCM